MRDSLRHRPIKLPRSSPYRSLTLVVALVLLAMLLLVLDQAGMLGAVRPQIQSLLTPAMRVLRQLGDGVSGVGQGLTEVTQLRDRVTALEAENSQLKASNLQIQELQLQLARAIPADHKGKVAAHFTLVIFDADGKKGRALDVRLDIDIA